MTQNLTVTTARNFQLPEGKQQVEIKDAQVPGLFLRVRAGGSRRYYVRRRVTGSNGNALRIVVGDAKIISLTEARKRAVRLIADMSEGIDPTAERRAQKAATAPETFKKAVDTYLVAHANGRLPQQRQKPSERTSEPNDLMRAAEMPVRRGKALGDLPVDEITADDARALIEALTVFAPATRRRRFGAARRLLEHCTHRRLIDSNPFASVKAPADSISRDRYLNAEELKSVWRACGQMGQYGRLVRFLFAMPVRISVAKFGVWGDIVIDQSVGPVFRVPADRQGNKLRTEIDLPLPEIALDLLGQRGLPDKPLFPGSRARFMTIRNDRKDKLDALSGVTGWTHHDARRTVVTLLADVEEDLSESAADRWLGHSRRGVAAVYQRSRRLKSMRKVADQWDAALREIIAEDVSSVVKLAR